MIRPQEAAGHVIDEMYAAGLLDDEGTVLVARMLQVDLLAMKGDLERYLPQLRLDGVREGIPPSPAG